MKLDSRVVIEVKKEENAFLFVMPSGASYGQAYDASLEIVQGILKMAKDAADKLKKEGSPKEEADGSSD